MSVDPELQAVLDLVAAAGEVDPRAVGPEGLRAGFEALSVLFGPVRDDVEVTEMTLQGRSGPITACRFEPAGGGDGSALIWFHGGGWVIGSVDTHASLCADLAVAAGTSVISVDYRLAPEHPFPAALDDALDATLAVVTDAGSSGVDPGRVAVGGDSAGGQLATVVARRFRDLGGPSLAAQVLVYPVTDLAAAPGEHPSQQESASGYLLTGATMDFFADCYAPVVENRGDPDLSPLRAPDLSGLPPALVLTAEHDLLRDEGEAYARALRSAGIDVVAERHAGTIHLFLQLAGTTSRARALAQIGSFLARPGGDAPAE